MGHMRNIKWPRQLTQWVIVAMVIIGLVGCLPAEAKAVNANPGDDMDTVQVNVTIDNAHLEQIDAVTEQLKAAGLDVTQTLSTLGIVSGSIDADKVDSLSEVNGVESVDVDKTITLPPPGSNIQ